LLENRRAGGLQIRVAILCTLQIRDGDNVGSIGCGAAGDACPAPAAGAQLPSSVTAESFSARLDLHSLATGANYLWGKSAEVYDFTHELDQFFLISLECPTGNPCNARGNKTK
jgi:hypothetical protein